MMLAVIWLLLCVVVASWASNWGRNALGFFLASLFLSPVIAGLWLLATGKDVKGIEQNAIEDGSQKKCPSCAELIKSEARKCRFCGTEMPEDGESGDCPKCGGEVEDLGNGKGVCKKCGIKLDEDQPSENR